MPLTAPVLTAGPADGSTDTDQTPTFSWNAVTGATGYKVSVDGSGGGGGGAPSQVGVLILENESSQLVAQANAPTLHGLQATYRDYTALVATTHPSLPNYAAMSCGSWLGKVGTDTATVGFAGSTPNIMHQLELAGKKWKGYEEAVTGSNYTAWQSSEYAARHCPAAFYTTTDKHGTPPSGNGRYDFTGSGGLLDDMTNSALPDFFWITPNLFNDGHSLKTATSDRIKFSDDWLAGLNPDGNNPPFPGITALIASMRPDGVLFITYDEGKQSAQTIYTVCVGQRVTHDVVSSAQSHWSLLYGIQQNFGQPKFTESGQNLEAGYTNLSAGVPIPQTGGGGTGGIDLGTTRTYTSPSLTLGGHDFQAWAYDGSGDGPHTTVDWQISSISPPAVIPTVQVIQENPPWTLTDKEIGRVDAIAYDPTNNILYVGGNFHGTNSIQQKDGTKLSRNYLIAIDWSTQELIASWNPAPNDRIFSIYVSPNGGRIYVGGAFTSIGSTPITMHNLACLNPAAGGNAGTVQTTRMADLGFNGVVHRLKATADGQTLFAAGDFTAPATTGTRLAKIDLSPTLATLVTTWKPSAGAHVRALAVDPNSNRLVVGGDFTTLNGVAKNFLGCIRQDGNGETLAFAYTPGDRVLDAATDGTNVYFGTVNDLLVKCDFATGTSQWGGKAEDTDGNVQAVCLNQPDSSTTYVVGGMHGDCVGNAVGAASGSYSGGSCGVATGVVRHKVWRQTASSGALDPAWDPSLTSSAGVLGVWALEAFADQVWMGGDFTKAQGVNHQRLVGFGTVSKPPPPPPKGNITARAGYGFGEGTTSASAAPPVSYQAGDMIVAHVTAVGAAALLAPAGWTAATPIVADGTAVASSIYTKTAGSPELASTFTCSGATSLTVYVTAWENAASVRSSGATKTTSGGTVTLASPTLTGLVSGDEVLTFASTTSGPRPYPDAGGLLFGAMDAPTDWSTQTGIAAIETVAGRGLAAAHSMVPWNCAVGQTGDFTGGAKAPTVDLAHNRLTYVSWPRPRPGAIAGEPSWQSVFGTTDPVTVLNAIAAGTHDAIIDNNAAAYAAFKHPIVIRLLWEMNGGGLIWGIGKSSQQANYATAYKAACQRIITRTRAVAKNVLFHWNPQNFQTVPGAAGSRDNMYWGDPSTDFAGTEGYLSPGDTWASVMTETTSNGQTYTAIYSGYGLASTHAKVLGNGEGGNRYQGSTDTTAAAARIDSLRTQLPNYPDWRIYMWWNGNGTNGDSRITSQPAACQSAFSNWLSQAYTKPRLARSWQPLPQTQEYEDRRTLGTTGTCYGTSQQGSTLVHTSSSGGTAAAVTFQTYGYGSHTAIQVALSSSGGPPPPPPPRPAVNADWTPAATGAWLLANVNLTASDADWATREGQVGRTFHGKMKYKAINTSSLTEMGGYLFASVAYPTVGSLPFSGNNTIPSINAGSQDANLIAFANACKNIAPTRVFLRLFWEHTLGGSRFNPANYVDGTGAAAPGTWADFIAAWQRVWTIFFGNQAAYTAAGIAGTPVLCSHSQVKFAYNPNKRIGTSVADPTLGYPGAGYVDWIMLDSYPTRVSGGSQVMDGFDTLVTHPSVATYTDWYATFSTYGKPLGIGEMSVHPVDDPAGAYGSGITPLTRVAWWGQIINLLKTQFPLIRLFTTFDADDAGGQTWKTDAASSTPNDSAAQAFAAYQTFTLDAYMNPGPGGSNDIADTFTRSTTSGWGTCDSGFDWTHFSGTKANVSTDGSVGVLAFPAPQILVEALTPTAGVDFTEITDYTDTFTFDANPVGADYQVAVLFRFQDMDNHYRMALKIGVSTVDRLTFVKRVGGVQTDLNAAFSLGTDFLIAGHTYARRLQCDIGGAMRAKVWDTAGAEPGSWTVDLAAPTSDPLPSGGIGQRVQVVSGATSTPNFHIDDIALTGISVNPPPGSAPAVPTFISTPPDSTLDTARWEVQFDPVSTSAEFRLQGVGTSDFDQGWQPLPFGANFTASFETAPVSPAPETLTFSVRSSNAIGTSPEASDSWTRLEPPPPPPPATGVVWWCTSGQAVNTSIAAQEAVVGRTFLGARMNINFVDPGIGPNDNQYDLGRIYTYRNSNWQTDFPKQPLSWAEVAKGTYDAQYIIPFFNALKADTGRWDGTSDVKTFYFSPHHEQTVNNPPNQVGFDPSGFPAGCGTVADYVDMYRHVRDLADQMHVTRRTKTGVANGGNCDFVYCPMTNMYIQPKAGAGVPEFDPDNTAGGTRPAAPPGTSYYEVLGIDWYNKWSATKGTLNHGNDAALIAGPVHSYAVQKGKDWIVPECGIGSDPSVSASEDAKAAYLTSMQNVLESYGSVTPGVCRALFYTPEANPAPDNYSFDSSPQVEAAATAMANDPWFMAGVINPPPPPVTPTVTVTQPVSGTTITGSSVNVSASASETGGGISQVTMSVNNGAAQTLSPSSVDAQGNGTYTATATLTTAASPGAANTIKVTVIDKQIPGQSVTSPTVTVNAITQVIDTTGPTLTINNPAGGNDATVTGVSGTKFTVSGVVTDASGVKSLVVAFGGNHTRTVAADGSFSYTATLATGANAFTVTATDNSPAQNQTVKSFTITLQDPVIPDTTPPTLVVTTPAADITIVAAAGDAYAVTGVATDASGIASVTVNGFTAAVAGDGSFSQPILLTSGANTVTVIATDASVNSNQTTITRTLTVISTLGPTVTVTSPLNGAVITGDDGYLLQVIGTATSTFGVGLLTVNGVATALATDGSFSQVVSLSTGQNTITVVAVDTQVIPRQTLVTLTVTLAPQVIDVGGTLVSSDQQRIADELQDRGVE